MDSDIIYTLLGISRLKLCIGGIMIEIAAPVYSDIEDFTFFCRNEGISRIFPNGIPDKLREELQWDETACLTGPFGAKRTPIRVAGRLHVSRCYGSEAISCSFRTTERIPDFARKDYHTRYEIELSQYNPNPKKQPNKTKPESQLKESKPVGEPKERYLNPVSDLCEVIYNRIFADPPTDAHGMIIVAGATATGKSKIARGLIYNYLKSQVTRKPNERRPHLVTFEDPIDKRWAANPESAKKTGIDYTPREVGKDVVSLELAVGASLRQTPKVFFVGETRNPSDWKELLRFASTGHLAVTTSHAGSLTEAMGQLFRASKADNPARRSDVANRILALVHLRSRKVPADENSDAAVNITIPAIWVRSPVSTKTLMADGLTALLPFRDSVNWDDDKGKAGEFGCLGRSWFGDKLLNRADSSINYKLFERVIRRTTLTWDLEGI